jgi:tetratricopeptide (TPR) repeat protein
MVARCLTWGLRIGAWLALLGVLARFAVSPRAAWIYGRLAQMQIATEHQQAAADFFRELGLDRHYDFGAFSFECVHPRRFHTPTLLSLRNAGEPQYEGRGAYFWLDAEAGCLLPPLIIGPLDPHQMTDFSALLLPRPAAAARRAIWCTRQSWDSGVMVEDEVWAFDDDRWVNLLRVGGVDLAGSGHRNAASPVRYWTDGDEVVFAWDQAGEQFLVPPNLGGITILERLPDQTAMGPIPSVPNESQTQNIAEGGDTGRLVDMFARASKDTGRTIKTPAWAFETAGNAALSSGNIRTAITIFRQSADMHPDSPQVYYDLGRAFSQAGEIELAVEHFWVAVELGRKATHDDVWIFEEALQQAEMRCPDISAPKE